MLTSDIDIDSGGGGQNIKQTVFTFMISIPTLPNTNITLAPNNMLMSDIDIDIDIDSGDRGQRGQNGVFRESNLLRRHF